jgi:hypothetical protein
MYSYTGHFVLGNDIDASPSMTKTYKVGTMGRFDSQTWDTEIEGFRGVFDGRGHNIDKLNTGNSGLLGDVLEGAVIKNLSITNANIKEGTAGVLCFMFSRATVENVYIDFTASTTAGGVFGRMNKVGTLRNVVIKYTNSVKPEDLKDPDKYTVGVLSTWQVNTKYIPLPVFDNVSFIYGAGTHVSNMQAIGNSTFTSADIKEYIIQDDGSLLKIKSKAASGNNFKNYTTGELNVDEFASYDEAVWDLSGAYPVLK